MTDKDIAARVVETVRGNMVRDMLALKETAEVAARFQYAQLRKAGIPEAVANEIIALAVTAN